VGVVDLDFDVVEHDSAGDVLLGKGELSLPRIREREALKRGDRAARRDRVEVPARDWRLDRRVGHAGQIDRADDREALAQQHVAPLRIALERQLLQRHHVRASTQERIRLRTESTADAPIDIP
jgi:hypothetical protein